MTVQADISARDVGGAAIAVEDPEPGRGVPGEPSGQRGSDRGRSRRAVWPVWTWVRRRPVLTGFLAILAVLAVVGIDGGLSAGTGTRGAASNRGPLATPMGPAAAKSSTAGAGQGSTAAPGGVQSAGGSAGGTGNPAGVPALPSRVIKTGSLNLQVPTGRLLATMSIMSNESTGLRGFVASSTTNTSTPGTAASADITLRVPVMSFEPLLADVEKLGRATSVATSGQDVTAQYVDLQARIRSLDDTRSQFQQILTRAQSIGDILAVEQQISDVQTEIEQYQGQLQVLEDQSSYSTLSAHVVEATAVAAPHPASGLAKAWDHARTSFTRGLDSIVAFSGGLALFLVVVGFLVVVARVGWVLVRRTA